MTYSLRSQVNWPPVLVAAGCLTLALMLGFIANIFPWWLTLPVAVAPLVLIVGLQSRPIFLFLSLAAIILVPLFKVQDVAFLGLCAYGALICIRQKINPFDSLTPKLLLALLFIAVLSAAFGYVVNGNTIEYVYNDGRVFMYWLVFPLLAAYTSPENRVKQICSIVIALGGVIASVAVVQGITGVALVGAGRVAALDSGGEGLGSTVNRVQIAGFPLVMAALFILWAEAAATSRLAFWKCGVFLVLLCGIYFNFGRAVWFWTAFCMVSIALCCGLRGAIMLLLAAVVGGLAVLVFTVSTDSTALEVAVQRLTSVGSEGGYGTSYGWREIENLAATSKLLNTYGLGVGIGGEYRDFYLPLRRFPDHVRYIHQGHLGLMLKISVLGWLYLLGILLANILRPWFKKPTDRDVWGLQIGASFTLFAFLLLNNTQPLLLAYDGVTAASLMLALLHHSQSKK